MRLIGAVAGAAWGDYSASCWLRAAPSRPWISGHRRRLLSCAGKTNGQTPPPVVARTVNASKRPRRPDASVVVNRSPRSFPGARGKSRFAVFRAPLWISAKRSTPRTKQWENVAGFAPAVRKSNETKAEHRVAGATRLRFALSIPPSTGRFPSSVWTWPPVVTRSPATKRMSARHFKSAATAFAAPGANRAPSFAAKTATATAAASLSTDRPRENVCGWR